MDSNDIIIDKLYDIEKELENIADELKLLGYWDMMDNINIVRKKIIREVNELPL